MKKKKRFALEYSGADKNMQQKEIDRGCELFYQITEEGFSYNEAAEKVASLYL